MNPPGTACLCFGSSSEQSSRFCETGDNQTSSPGKSSFVRPTAHLLSLIGKDFPCPLWKKSLNFSRAGGCPLPSHLFSSTKYKLWHWGLPTILKQLFNPFPLPSNTATSIISLDSECIGCILCPFLEMWAYFFLQSLSLQLNHRQKSKAHGSRSSCFSLLCQLRCPPSHQTANVWAKPGFGTQK